MFHFRPSNSQLNHLQLAGRWEVEVELVLLLISLWNWVNQQQRIRPGW
jgi:hypothetical protein